MSRTLGAKLRIAHEGSSRGCLKPRRYRSCVSALSSRTSNRPGVIAFLTPLIVLGYRDDVGHEWLTSGQPSLGRTVLSTEPTARPYGSDDLWRKEGTCVTEARPVRPFPDARQQWRSWTCDGKEYAEIKNGVRSPCVIRKHRPAILAIQVTSIIVT
jgi:hypothetical protein